MEALLDEIFVKYGLAFVVLVVALIWVLRAAKKLQDQKDELHRRHEELYDRWLQERLDNQDKMAEVITRNNEVLKKVEEALRY